MNETETSMTDDTKPTMRALLILNGYPLALILISILINWLAWGIRPISPALPAPDALAALGFAGALLLINHTWLMTSTELVRSRFGMAAAPEEREAESSSPTQQAKDELERRLNAHRNTTENIVYFSLLALPLAFISAPTFAVQFWALGFALARLGYTYSYTRAHIGARGLFMTVSLIALYGMASYLVLAAFA